MTVTNTKLESWQMAGEQKRQEIDRLLPKQWKLEQVPPAEELKDASQLPREHLSKEEIEITEVASAAALLKKISDGELSAVNVARAFCHRATIAHQLTNCLSEVMFDQAIKDAEALDRSLKENGKVVGPLHGLPVSLKDQFRVRDTETSLGFVAYLGKKETAATESLLVRQLRQLGAIVFVKTNVPSSLMAIETNNNVIGYTLNARNRLTSSAGSSGGEAALIAMGGSLLGLASDMGASIRMPAGYNGIVGLRPSIGRLPYLGALTSMLGQKTMESVIGPMGKNVEDLRLLTKTLLEMHPWDTDPQVVNIPWRHAEEERIKEKLATKTLKLGVLRSDDTVQPQPPVRRVLDEAVRKLQAQGYEIVEWEPPSHAEAYDIAWHAFTADAGKDIHDSLSSSGEQPVPELSTVYGNSYGHLPQRTINFLYDAQWKQYNYQTKYLEYWNSTAAKTTTLEPVDALIMPVAPTVGFERSKGIYAGYTAVFNVLDYSAAAIRGGTANKDVDVVDTEFKSMGDLDAVIQGQYDPQIFDGSPVGLQIVCKRLEEEKVLAIADGLDKIINGI